MIAAGLEFAVKKITSVLRDRDEKEITGAMLGELIRKIVPELNIREIVEVPSGPGALSRFVDGYLTHVLIKDRRQGSDPVYRICAEQVANCDVEIWQTFVRHQSSRILVLDKKSFTLGTPYAADFSPNSELVEVKRAMNVELDEIRNKYTDLLHRNSPELESKLPWRGQPFNEWSATVKELGREQFRSWGEFRVEQILDLFMARLSELEVPDDERSRLRDQMRRSQALGRAISSSQKGEQDESASLSNSRNLTHGSGDSLLREVISAVIPMLSTADLRDLKLPAGILVDALFNASRK